MERLTKQIVLERAAVLFTPNTLFSWPKQMRAFNYTNPPPQVTISIVFPDTFIPKALSSSELIHLCEDPFIGKSGVLLGRAEGRLATGSRCLATDIS